MFFLASHPYTTGLPECLSDAYMAVGGFGSLRHGIGISMKPCESFHLSKSCLWSLFAQSRFNTMNVTHKDTQWPLPI